MHTPQQHRSILHDIARRAMLERGLQPAFSAAVDEEVEAIRVAAAGTSAAAAGAAGARDLRDLPWASIDNDDSRDLDQLTVAEELTGHHVRIRVAVADVDALVKDGMAIDAHAQQNTTSVYTAGAVFPMLPELLSTDLTSLNPGDDRLAVVIEFLVDPDGAVHNESIYRARVRNHAKLAYPGIARWLEGKGPIPTAVASASGLPTNLRTQDQVAQRLKHLRQLQGALSLDTIRARPVFDGDALASLDVDRKNRATEIIEDFMIAANGVTARYLAAKHFPSIRRVVRVPKRWDRIVALAAEHGTVLPAAADSRALDVFLAERRAADPLRFADLSLAVIKLLGRGEHVAEPAGAVSPGHFGLAVDDYTHSTAPNRRYPDIVTQRLLKAAMAGAVSPYTAEQLDVLARHFTEAEDAANKVERHVGKSAAAMLLESRIGEHFDALVTGASAKGTWARLLSIPVEGRVMRGSDGLDVGDRLRVQLLSTDVQRGFIDFARVESDAATGAR